MMKKILPVILVLLSVYSFSQPAISPVLYPQYMQGHGTGNATDERRIPYACRMTLSGLLPNQIYNYYNRWTVSSGNSVEQGGIIIPELFGNWRRITGPSLGDPNARGSFVTDGNGSYTGWFISESNIATTEFAPGQTIYFRVVLDVPGGVNPMRITATDAVTVLAWDDYFAIPPAGPPVPQYGTGLRSVDANTQWNPKNFMMFWDNVDGTGRPIAGTFVESDGSPNSIVNGYVPFYANNINGINNRWAAIIPDALPSGIQNISQYSFINGDLINSCSDDDGDWGGANGNTIDPTGGLTTAKIIDCTPSTLCNINLSSSVTNVTCFGQSTGAINLTISGGTAPYTISWSNGATTEDLVGIPAGTYQVNIVDVNNCTNFLSVTVIQPTSIIANAVASDATCSNSNGSVNLTVSGGTPTPALTITQDFNTLASTGTTGSATPAGWVFAESGTGANTTYGVGTGSSTTGDTYSFGLASNTDRAFGGLRSGTSIPTIGASFSNTTVSTVTSLVISYTGEQWRLGATNRTDRLDFQYSTDATSLTTGTWIDFDGLDFTAPVTLGTIGALNGSLTANRTAISGMISGLSVAPGATVWIRWNDLDATGSDDGLAVDDFSIGLANNSSYIYSWSNGATTEDINSLAAGTYNVTITDANGCTATTSATVNTTAGPGVTATSTPANNGNSGTATANATGGTSPYTYLWSPGGQTTTTATNLAAGTYNVTVTDANGCTATASTTVTGPACNISASATPVNATCGNNNGSVNLTVTGGTSPFTYIWSNAATTEDINGLAPGIYIVTVTDANSCTATASATVSNIAGPGASAVASNATCGNNNGSVNLAVTGGTSPYSYSWSNGATIEDISELTAGTYNVTVTDANGCTAIGSASVSSAGGATVTVSSTTNVSCFGGNNGAINITVSSGTMPYTFNWSNGAATEDISGLIAGMYSVTVTDGSGCPSIANATITQPASALNASAVATNATCGNNNGSVNLAVTGGTSPYSYSWSNGATIEDISGLAAGTYTVTVTDANSCTATATATVNNIAGPSVTASSNPANNGNNGTGTANVVGGTGPFTYLWSPGGQTTSTATGLAAGIYNVTVTDANGCTATAMTTVEGGQVCNISASAITTNATCGNANGSVNLTVTGGTASFTYAWSNGATTEDISALAAGTYNVTVTDANGCTATASASVSSAGGATVTISSTTNVSCFGGNNGAINITVSSGTMPYTFNWSNGATTEDISGLAAGMYSVTVTDGSGCPSIANATITQPASAVNASAVASNATCGNNNGSVNLTVTGGTSPYNYSWSNGATTEDINSLAAGTYNVTVTVSSTTNVSCFGGNNGAINITVSGGTQPYTFNWSTGSATEDINGLIAGMYSVTVTDGSGCPAIANATITQPASALNASAVVTNATCGSNNGSVNLTVTGGTSPYNYSWSNGATTEDINSLAAGTYNVTVTDANGCTATASASVSSAGGATVTVNNTTNVSCFGASNGSINITVNGGTMPYSFNWSNGSTTEDISGLIAGTYSVTVTDESGCPSIASIAITQPASALNASATATNATCSNNNGSVNLAVTGGTSSYRFSWSNGAITEDISGLAAGTYNVTVTDANGCTATTSASVNTTAGPGVTATSTPANNGNNGTATANVTGGTSPYTYLWSPGGQATATATNLAAGLYNVTVTDANRCTTTASTIVTGSTCNISANAIASNATCGNSNGSINLTVTGGTPPFTYAWSNGASIEDISGVAAGTYTITVTDANSCTATATATVNNIVGPTASAAATNATCGNNNGSVNVTATDGTSPYNYSWSNGATTKDISGLAAGTYNVTVTDANGCTATASASVSSAGGATVTVSNTTNVSCFGASNGSINITVSGGTMPYTFNWSNGATTEDISGLSAGMYSVTVTDVKGCIATGNASVTQPASALVVNAMANEISCDATSTAAVISATGGTAPYTGTGTFTVGAGAHQFAVTDANGCTQTTSVTIAPVTPCETACIKTHTITNNFIKTPIAAGNYIWFNSVLDLENRCGDQPVVITVTDAKIEYRRNNELITLSVQDAVIRYSASTNMATTQFINGKWEINAPLETNGRNVFMSGLAYLVPAGGISAGTSPVKWTSTIAVNREGVKIKWKWGAAVYSQFSPNHSSLGVKPIDGNLQNPYNNMHNAGTPEFFTNWLIPGGTGTGQTNYTGSYSSSKNISCNECGDDQNRNLITSGGLNTGSIKKTIASSHSLTVTVRPNPSTNYFELLINTNSNQKNIIVKIMDVYGRLLSVHKNISTDELLRVGDTWINGIYFAEVIQGDQRKVVKLIKAD